ncbi:MAG: hypothetical protein M0Q13_05740 [Methanothrix sp.]|nr:hypothetical protein [Methanothrix sp.]
MSEIVNVHITETTSFDFAMHSFKKWTVKYINTLPDSSFAVIEPAYIKGETTDKRCRHLPYRDNEGKIDLPHLRNALARVNQIKPITNSITTTELRKQAMDKLEKVKEESKTA